MTSILIRNGTLITQNSELDILEGNLFVEDGQILEMPSARQKADRIIDARGKLVLPGFVQVHVHLNQTLFRGLADDLDVVDWLRLWIWPLEQAHDYQSLYASARLSIAEMIRGGTTSVMTMETTNHTEAAFQAAEEMGMRVTIGNAMMDAWEAGTDMIGEPTDVALKKSLDLLKKYHNSAGGRLKFAFCPRGGRNVTNDTWRMVAQLAREYGVGLHTHIGENREQAERLENQHGIREIDNLNNLGALGSNLVIAHGVWLNEKEIDLVAKNNASIAHCPSANMKLASGYAPIPDMLRSGVNVALGSDGAPCNNNLDAFNEMRLAGLIHKPRYGPKSMPAQTVLNMMTRGGARAMGLEEEIGSLEIGKRADITILNRDMLHICPRQHADPVGQVVYEHRADDVDTVIIDGRVLLEDGNFTCWEAGKIIEDSEDSLTQVLTRANLGSSS
jgi:5-methylthioadenosine/S-adenosylhomocysteine deaminase